jgi:predicted phage-related endonuclease
MLTAYQKALRQNHIGASEWAMVLGRSKWGDASQLYYQKTMPLVDEAGTDSTSMGDWMEGPLVEWACQELGVEATRNQFRVSGNGDGGILSATHDALIVGKQEGLECKFVGPQNADGWGIEEATDQVPEEVILQCQGQCHVSNLEVVWIPVLLCTGFYPKRKLFKVERNQELIDICVPLLVRFWRENIEKRVPPTLDPPPLEILKRLIREPDSVRTLDEAESAAAMLAWEERKAASIAKNEAEAAYERATAKCLQHLVDADAAQLSDGTQLRYLIENSQASVDKDGLRLEYPEAYAKFVTPGTRRVLRLKQPPKKKKG